MTEIRELRVDEIGFIKEMLWTALAWRPGVELPPREIVLAHPQVIVFHAGWGRLGDVGLVAEDTGDPIGLVWYWSFTEEVQVRGSSTRRRPSSPSQSSTSTAAGASAPS